MTKNQKALLQDVIDYSQVLGAPSTNALARFCYARSGYGTKHRYCDHGSLYNTSLQERLATLVKLGLLSHTEEWHGYLKIHRWHVTEEGFKDAIE